MSKADYTRSNKFIKYACVSCLCKFMNVKKVICTSQNDCSFLIHSNKFTELAQAYLTNLLERVWLDLRPIFIIYKPFLF